jgi:hypothetical protein
MILLLKISGKKNLLKQKKNKTLSAQLHSIFQHLMDLRKAPRVQTLRQVSDGTTTAQFKCPKCCHVKVFKEIFW